MQFLYCDRGTLELVVPSGRDSIRSAPTFRAGLLYVESPPIVLLGTVARF